MKFHLTIDCDNAAFEPEAGAELQEVARILKDLAGRLEKRWVGQINGMDDFLWDLNGNRVGLWRFTGKRVKS